MPFNKNITGYANEVEFAKYLNGKTVGKVHPLFQDLLYTLYGHLNDNEIIYS